MAQLQIGTSGWNYQHWRERFYPSGLGAAHWLEYYAQYFNSAEVNYSFYRLPGRETYKKWLGQVPKSFLFALKCSRLITHSKRLKNCEELWQNFVNSAWTLHGALGPILFQLPENFAVDTDVLNEFLSMVTHSNGHHKRLRLAMEFRHESWFCQPVYKLLEQYNVALVAADSHRYTRVDRVTADLFYLRYHGPRALFGSNYTAKRLHKESEKIEKLLAKGLDVFAYFNNDAYGFAVKNAIALSALLANDARSLAR
jgi:uncharacterized protein YecE (DUF72 family)